MLKSFRNFEQQVAMVIVWKKNGIFSLDISFSVFTIDWKLTHEFPHWIILETVSIVRLVRQHKQRILMDPYILQLE